MNEETALTDADRQSIEQICSYWFGENISTWSKTYPLKTKVWFKVQERVDQEIKEKFEQVLIDVAKAEQYSLSTLANDRSRKSGSDSAPGSVPSKYLSRDVGHVRIRFLGSAVSLENNRRSTSRETLQFTRTSVSLSFSGSYGEPG